jgi:hypothetical protein
LEGPDEATLSKEEFFPPQTKIGRRVILRNTRPVFYLEMAPPKKKSLPSSSVTGIFLRAGKRELQPFGNIPPSQEDTEPPITQNLPKKRSPGDLDRRSENIHIVQ